MGFAKFVPHAMKVSEVCVVSYDRKSMCGILTSPFYVEQREFQSLTELLLMLEEAQDQLGYPERTVEYRSFSGVQALGKNSDGEAGRELPQKALATFRVSVFFRQNATWQGSVYWVEKDEVANFRSVFEMIKLFDSALGRPGEGASPEQAVSKHP